MNNDPKRQQDDALLDAILGGEAWPELNAATKRAALAEFQTRQRRRRTRLCLAQAAAIALLAVGIMEWPHPTAEVQMAKLPAKKIPQTASAPPVRVTLPKPAAASSPNYISEAEMLALFPKGSCTIAVIEGKRQLVFLDPKVERDGAIYQPGS